MANSLLGGYAAETYVHTRILLQSETSEVHLQYTSPIQLGRYSKRSNTSYNAAIDIGLIANPQWSIFAFSNALP